MNNNHADQTAQMCRLVCAFVVQFTCNMSFSCRGPYEGRLESSEHGIITPQCADKMLSNNIFSETRIQRLLGGLIFFEKRLGVHVQRMLKMSRGLYTGGNFKQNTWKKAKENWGPLKPF